MKVISTAILQQQLKGIETDIDSVEADLEILKGALWTETRRRLAQLYRRSMRLQRKIRERKIIEGVRIKRCL